MYDHSSILTRITMMMFPYDEKLRDGKAQELRHKVAGQRLEKQIEILMEIENTLRKCTQR